MAEVLKIEGLSLKIKEKEILKNIDFKVNKGEIVGLIGINGSGKTTLLKCLNGLNRIEKGSIYIKNREIKSFTSKELAKEVAFMAQNTSINIPFKVLEVVVMGRYPYLKNGDFLSSDYEKAKKYMEATDTLKFKDRKIDELSGGERQRVIFAKTLTQESGIFLLDEPSASMDLSNQEQLFKMCKDISNAGKSVIVSIHDLKVAARYCDKLLLMKDGERIAFGTVEEVLTKENIKKGYGIEIELFRNPISKKIDFCILD